MSRIRNIKPQFFKDAELYDAEVGTGLPMRIAYAGLWTVADRAGRFKWKPREIKTDILPYDAVDMEAVLNGLVKFGFIFKYKTAGFDYGFIPNFEKHQFINRNEAQSTIPAPTENSNEQSPPLIHSELLVVLDTDTDGLTQTMKDAAPPLPKPVRKSLSSLPDNFPPPSLFPSAIAYWQERDRLDLDAAEQATQFRAHHMQHGKRMADWGAAWVTWYSNAIKFNRKPNNGQGKRSAHDNLNAGTVLYLQNLAAESGGQGPDSGPPDETRKLLLAP